MPLYVAKLCNPLILDNALSVEDEAAALHSTAKAREYVQNSAPYVALLKNHQELEQHFARADEDLASATTLRNAQYFDALMLETNRLLMNFLASARAYIDLTDNRLAHKDELLAARFETWKSVQYDSSFSYRLCEKLRNYSQHRSFPLRAYSATSTLQTDGSMASSQTFLIDRVVLLTSPKIKGQVRKELEAIEKNIPIRPHVSNYVACLNLVQIQLERATLEEHLPHAGVVEQFVCNAGDPKVEPIGFVRRSGSDEEPTLQIIDAHFHGAFMIRTTENAISRIDFAKYDAAARAHPKWRG